MIDILVISDSPTFLLEKTSKSNNIQIEKIIAFGPECEKQITKRYGSCLLLITKSFYDNLESISIYKDENRQHTEFIFNILDRLIKNLSYQGTLIYFPFLPKHFIFRDSFNEYFYEYNSKDIIIQDINTKLFKSYSHFSNLVFLIGIEKISSVISKDYFRFSSIYNEENSSKILNQIHHYEKIKNQKKKKLIIVDLDNTLWKGTLGDDSINGINIDRSDAIGSVFRSVQKILLDLKNKGFLLAICSKNNKDLALSALFEKGKSIFSKSDIVSYRINWEPKSKNIIEICNELNISLMDTIFIDDSDYECDEVRHNCIGISIFKVPKNIFKYPVNMSKSELFHLNYLTKEDKDRTKSYQENIKRNELFKDKSNKINSKDDWIRSLNLVLETQKISLNNKNIPRVIQLFNRTNQFNLSGRKFNDSSFFDILNKDNHTYYFGQSSDRIGNEGIISTLGFQVKNKQIVIEDYILSCRVFGKYIEEMMLIPVFKIAIINSFDINFKYKKNERNLLISDFLSTITNRNFYLTVEEIINLKNKFSEFPTKLIDKVNSKK